MQLFTCRASSVLALTAVLSGCSQPTPMPCIAPEELQEYPLGSSYWEIRMRKGFRPSESDDNELVKYFDSPSRFQGMEVVFDDQRAVEVAAFRYYGKDTAGKMSSLRSSIARELEGAYGSTEDIHIVRRGSSRLGYALFSVALWRRECGTIVLIYNEPTDLERIVSASGFGADIYVAVIIATPERADRFLAP